MQAVERYVLFHSHLLLVNDPVIVVGLLSVNLDGDDIHHEDFINPQTDVMTGFLDISKLGICE